MLDRTGFTRCKGSEVLLCVCIESLKFNSQYRVGNRRPIFCWHPFTWVLVWFKLHEDPCKNGSLEYQHDPCGLWFWTIGTYPPFKGTFLGTHRLQAMDLWDEEVWASAWEQNYRKNRLLTGNPISEHAKSFHRKSDFFFGNWYLQSISQVQWFPQRWKKIEMMMEGICRIDEHFHFTCDFATDEKPPNKFCSLGTLIF